MNLSNFEEFFLDEVLERARRLYEEGRVKRLEFLEIDEWSAEVIGDSDIYELYFDMDEEQDINDFTCDCPYDWGGPCKHMGAVLFALRERMEADAYTDKLQWRLEDGGEDHFNEEDEQIDYWRLWAVNPKKEFPPLEKMLEMYDKLPDAEKKIMKVLAVAWEPLTQTAIMQCYNKGRLIYLNRNIYNAEVKAGIIHLVKEGLISNFYYKSHMHFKCSDLLADELMRRDYHKDRDFIRAIKGLQEIKPDNSRWTWEIDYVRKFRNMRMAFYTGDIDFAMEVMNILCDYDDDPLLPLELLMAYWFGEEYDPAHIQHLPMSSQALLLEMALEMSIVRPCDSGKVLDCAFQVYERVPDASSETLIPVMMKICFLRADWGKLEKLYAHSDVTVQNAYDALKYLVTGKRESTIMVLEVVNKLLKNNEELKAVLADFIGVFLVIAYLSTQDKQKLTKGRKWAKKMQSEKNYFVDFKPVFCNLEGLCEFFETYDLKEVKWYLKNCGQGKGIVQMFQMLCWYWYDVESVPPEDLKEYAQKMFDAGFLWVAREVNAVLARLGSPIEQIGQPEEQPLCDLLQPKERWEVVLEALSDLADTGSKRSENQRLAWFVDFERGVIGPKIQKMGKKGWTKGRKVSMYDLLQNHAHLLDTDERAFVALFEDSSYDMGYEYRLHGAREVWKYLIGNPRLFLLKSPEIAIQLIESNPYVMVKQSEEGYQFEAWPGEKLIEQSPVIIKETPTRYLYVEAPPAVKQVAQALDGGNVMIPAKAEGRLKQIITLLSRHIDVRAPFLLEDLPKVEPDACPCLHLIPVGDGYHLEVYVKPFGSVPPYCKPASGEPFQMAVIEGGQVTTSRVLDEEERRFMKLLKDVPALAEVERQDTYIWVLKNDYACLKVLQELNPLLENGHITIEWPRGEKLKLRGELGFDKMKVQVRDKGTWFEVSGEIQVDEQHVLTLQELLRLSKQESPFVEIGPGKFLALTRELTKKLSAIEGAFSQGKNEELQLTPLATHILDDLTERAGEVELDRAFIENKERIKAAFQKKARMPRGFQAVLRPYQKEGYQWLHRCAEWGVGACLADDMGLGKTVQALAFLSSRSKLGPALVVTPASVCRNWRAETEKFAPNLKPLLFGEGDRARMVKKAKAKDVIIVTYDLMTREAALFIEKEFATIILDEAQAIKNRATRRAKTAMQLQGQFKMTMTGTPIENHLGELWTQFRFLNPGLLGSLDSFKKRFSLPIEKYKDEARREQLRRLVQPFILRRHKRDVLKDLPEKTEITLTVQLSPEERAFYEAMRRNALENLLNKRVDRDTQPGQEHLQVLAEIMRLRRAACHPRLVKDNPGIKHSAKMSLFEEVVQELRDNNHKALVFSQFVGHLKLLEERLKAMKVKYQYLDGSTPLKKREERINAFQAGEGDVFLISLKAGGTGLNLTAADYVIHMDPWWNPAIEDQATDRAHRIGQERPVTVYRLVSENTIEEKILELHARKRDLADALLAGTDVSAKLNAEELMKLIAEQ